MAFPNNLYKVPSIWRSKHTWPNEFLSFCTAERNHLWWLEVEMEKDSNFGIMFWVNTITVMPNLYSFMFYYFYTLLQHYHNFGVQIDNISFFEGF